jgi:hypothetical protein
MKTFNFPKTFLAVIAATGLALSATAQNSAPVLAYGVPQVLQLAQAKVSDDTIIAYIHNSGNSYNLNADQIIYLRQQGVSDNVLNVMLTQPKPASAPVATPPDNSYQVPAPATPAPAPVTYVQSAPPPSTVYVVPNSQNYYYNTYAQPYYYPYSYFPSVSLAFAFGGGSSYHGGYYYGGYHGGYYGGGGYHGGGGHPPGGYPGGGGGGGHPPSGGGWHH